LLGPPKLTDDVAVVFDELEEERKHDLGREIDLESGT